MTLYTNEEERKKDIAKNREVAAFSYLLILSPVLLFTRRDSHFIQFHARQATFLFVAAIIFAQLSTPWSWMNFFVLAICLTGFIQANFGAEWRAPVVANIIETGVNGDRIWKGLVHYFGILKQVFVHSKKEKKKEPEMPNIPTETATNVSGVLAQQNEVLRFQRERISFLERELLLVNILRKNGVNEFSQKEKDTIRNYTQELANAVSKNAKIEIDPAFMDIQYQDEEILFGGFDKTEKTAWVYSTITLSQGKNFGEFFGQKIYLDDEKEQKKLLADIKKNIGK